MSATLNCKQHRLAPDSTRPADDETNLPAQFSFRRLTANLRFLQGPILDAERFRWRERNVVRLHLERFRLRGGSRLRQHGRLRTARARSPERSRALRHMYRVRIKF